jgi:hypothetical protein
MAAAKAFAKLGEERGKKFRFVFTSGILAVKDPKEKVWIYAEARKVAVSLYNLNPPSNSGPLVNPFRPYLFPPLEYKRTKLTKQSGRSRNSTPCILQKEREEF